LWFFIKTNDYGMNDWRWLIAKVERRILLWCNKWFSRGGRPILVKLVLEVIPMFWNFLSFIPKGVLEKTKRINFRFFWVGKRGSRENQKD